VGVEERGVLGGDDDVGLAEHVERPTARHAVDRGDDRLPEVVGLGVDVVAGVVVHERRRHPAGLVGGARIVEVLGDGLGPVDAGAERLLPGAGEDHAADVVVAAQGGPQVPHLVLHLHVERVVHLGSVQRDDGNVIALFVPERLVLAHGTPSSSLVVVAAD
jgi:hypothetical protein